MQVSRFAPSVSVKLLPAPSNGNTPPDQPVAQEETFSWNGQDRRMMEANTKVIPGVIQGSVGPEVARAKLNEALEKQDGKYVYGHDDPRQNTAVAFSAVANTINVFQEVFGDWKWAFGREKLAINANAGEMLNAYYSRNGGSVNFFKYPDPLQGQNVHSGASGEIVSHETGHAILDGIRPGYLGSWGPDPGAFHESFGDMLGIHMSLMDERVLNRVMVQTKGDLSLPNVAALTAEELGVAINDNKGYNKTGGDYLRNANNHFVWQDPDTLPDTGGPDQLGSEVHSFSRLWTGAHFDVLKGLVAEKVASGMEAKAAIQASNMELLTMLANLVKDGPKGEFTYREMAEAFLASDQKNAEGKHVDLLRKVFTDRKILPEDAPPPGDSRGLEEESTLGHVTVRLDASCGMFCGAEVEVPVDSHKSLFQSAEVRTACQKNVKRLIEQGKVRYNDPGYQMKFPQDAFNAKGEPYVGTVVWENGQMKIERLAVAD